MSEQLNECDLHPTEKNGFKRSVLHALMARQALGFVSGAPTLPSPDEVKTSFVTALGVDEAYSQLVNECASRIANGSCSRYFAYPNGHGVTGVTIEARSEV